MFTGSRKQIDLLEKSFIDKYACKIEKIGRSKDLAKAARFLNRVVSFTAKGIELEGDQRLVEGIIHGMGVKDASPVSNPGTKAKPVSKEAHKDLMSRRMEGLNGNGAE